MASPSTEVGAVIVQERYNGADDGPPTDLLLNTTHEADGSGLKLLPSPRLNLL